MRQINHLPLIRSSDFVAAAPKRCAIFWVTTFNEYAVVSENRLTPVPASIDRRTAPLLGCAVTTALGVVNNDARVAIGESVVVFGVGGVGLNIVQFAAMVGAAAGHPAAGPSRRSRQDRL